MNGVPHHSIQPFILGLPAQPNFPFGQEGRQRELVENLMIEILGNQERVLFALVKKDLACALAR